jgi:hypothetical protein
MFYNYQLMQQSIETIVEIERGINVALTQHGKVQTHLVVNALQNLITQNYLSLLDTSNFEIHFVPSTDESIHVSMNYCKAQKVIKLKSKASK